MSISHTNKKKLDNIQHSKKAPAGVNSDFCESMLFSRGKKTTAFFTEDSKLYITPKQAALMRRGVKLNRGIGRWDSLSSRIASDFVRYQPSQSSLLAQALERRLNLISDSMNEAAQTLSGQFTLVRVWNFSIVGAILFGMVTMTFVYRYLGQGASAQLKPVVATEQSVGQDFVGSPKVLGMQDIKNEKEIEKGAIENKKAQEEAEFENKIREMVKGRPIEDMVPYIVKKDKIVAAFMIAIARKESSWGVRVPVLNGQDCYNYWGYRSQRKLMGTGGHTCFNSRKDAVDTVAKRLKTLAIDNEKNTPAKMVLWKCGSNCEATGGQAAADKWIEDVDEIFKKLNK